MGKGNKSIMRPMFGSYDGRKNYSLTEEVKKNMDEKYFVIRKEDVVQM